MTTLAFWQAAGERAIKTFAQFLITLIGTEKVGLLVLPWGDYVGIAATGALLSLLTSIVSSPIGNPGPSLASETVAPVVPANAVVIVPAP